LGDGFVHGSPVSSIHCDRRHPSAGITMSCAPIPNFSLNNLASSPTVIPWRAGIGYIPTNDVNPGLMSAPSTISPPIGLGRSSTTKGMPWRFAACIDSAIEET
jgi:hypothetical protein